MPVTHFTVHDIRCTCRSLLAEAGVAGHVAERYLNHRFKGVRTYYGKTKISEPYLFFLFLHQLGICLHRYYYLQSKMPSNHNIS